MNASDYDSLKCTLDPQRDVVCSAVEFKFRDPLEGVRIGVPVRGRNCAHEQCFDTSSYIDAVLRDKDLLRGSICPLCPEQLGKNLEHLAVDEYFERLLQNEALDASTVLTITRNPQGSLEVAVGQEEGVVSDAETASEEGTEDYRPAAKRAAELVGKRVDPLLEIRQDLLRLEPEGNVMDVSDLEVLDLVNRVLHITSLPPRTFPSDLLSFLVLLEEEGKSCYVNPNRTVALVLCATLEKAQEILKRQLDSHALVW
uniref:SP-RING-type domain-containing protein n=1 Tax=Chromera velia CCMP2878 TaxID=1169474 RepID=A0A0G4G5Q9_9ALVE|eukprot:Cvel_4192.t1-p1 / transcript=Cvel_4192.t1 / gene=Cvel_4192 / organism=Chromera_velia_CCMP2878 / gene_product=hypothetical protein / transcript_product=hypothetical protein / location=Cvel_scaffold181:3890-5413(-) / protein_length=255 / sequence_SO=supercontig / SO=protein_coding / is_pseudo=false